MSDIKNAVPDGEQSANTPDPYGRIFIDAPGLALFDGRIWWRPIEPEPASPEPVFYDTEFCDWWD